MESIKWKINEQWSWEFDESWIDCVINWFKRLSHVDYDSWAEIGDLAKILPLLNNVRKWTFGIYGISNTRVLQ